MPRDDQTNMGAHFVGSRDSFRSVKKWHEIIFLRSWDPNSDISSVSSSPLRRFYVALGSSYGFPGCFGEASGAQEVALEAPEGAREKRFLAQMHPGAPPKLKINVLEDLWF